VTVRERLIVALDFSSLDEATALVDRLGDEVERYKVGLELYTSCGPIAVEKLVARKKRVFLDLKLHDIPETVRRAAQAAARLGAELVTVHASGGKAMLAAAVEGAGATKILAVTVLTSLDLADLRADGFAGASTEELVTERAALARSCGVFGVVASPLEAAAIRRRFKPAELAIVTPGVRFAAAGDDQKRVATPRAARDAGADAIVVGRPIRDAQDPVAAARRFVEELA
jgi:orotidine-5'-phosphate decarboxylase